MKAFFKTAGIGLASGALALSLVACGETETSSSSTPTVAEPAAPVVPKVWNDDASKTSLEETIKSSAANQFTGAEQNIASVSCTATSTKFIWNCDIRKLGEPEPTPFRVEVAEDGSSWAGQPIY